MTRIYKTWVERIESGAFNYAQMLQFCQAIGSLARGMRAGGKHTALTQDEANDLYERFAALPDGLDLFGNTMRVHDKTWKQVGREWIAAHGRRVGLPKEMVAVADQLDFRFVSTMNHSTNAWPAVGPVYRAFVPGTDLSWRYAPTPWQASAWGDKQGGCWWERESETSRAR